MKGVKKMKATGWKRDCTFAGVGKNGSVVHASEWAIWMRGRWTDRRRCTTRFEEGVFAARLLKLDPEGSRQWRILGVGNWQDRVTHTEILGLSLVDWVVVC